MLKRFLVWLSGLLVKDTKKTRTREWTIFLALMSPALIVALYNSVTTYHDLTNFTLSRREAIARLAATTLEQKLGRLVDIGVSFATRVQFRRLIGEGKWDDAIRILGGVPRDFPFIDRLFLADPSGTLVADTPALPGVMGTNFSHRDWYKGLSSSWTPYVSEVYKRAAEPRYNVVAVALPIKSEKNAVIGILVLQVRLDAIFKWLRDIDVGQEGFIYFVDGKGHIAAHPKISSQGEIVDYSSVLAVQKVLSGERGVGILYSHVDKEERVVAYAPVPSFKWGAVVSQPLRAAFAARDENLRRLLGVYGFIILINCGLAYLILWSIGRLRQAEAASSFLASIVRSSGDAIIGETLDGIILSWNTGAEQVYGYSEQEVKGQPVSILIPSDRSDELPEILSRIRRGENFEHYETVRMRKDGRCIDISLTASPIKDANGEITGASIIARDISQQKQAEQTIKKLNEELKRRAIELEAANKELETFSYSVSHDLRAPLRSIDGFNQALLEDYADKLDDEGKDYLQRVRSSAQHMGKLIDDMLNLSRVTRGEIRREPVDLTGMAQALAAELQESAPDREVEFVIADGLTAQGDARLLRIVMENLLGNAWKYSSKHPRARIEFGFAQNNGQSAYFVRDDGAGFDMAYADKLFGVFQRLHRQTEFSGTGVGLATVQRIMHRHGGQVWADAQVDKGATFYFTVERTRHEP